MFLDYGADAVDAETAACEICERGMRFSSPWRFDLGAVLRIVFAFEDDSPQRVEAEGFVVECTPAEDGIHQTTLAFLEPAQDFRASLGKVSTRLEMPARGSKPLAAGSRP